MKDIKEERKASTEPRIDPKDLMAVERATTALFGTSISLIVLGFVVEKFQLFLAIVAVEITGAGKEVEIPQLAHSKLYNYLGITIVAAGIVLALYTYRYYTRWIEHLQRGEIDTDKEIYLYLALFVAAVGTTLLLSMIVI